MSHNSQIPGKKILVCLVNRKIFEWSLIWPAEGTELRPGFAYKLKLALCCILIAFTIIPSGIVLFFMIKGK